MQIVDQAGRIIGPFDWTIGGGTMLYRKYRHRHSRDIDIFVADAQALPALSPRLNEVAAAYAERLSGSYVEQSNFVKLLLPDGEIDFIVAPHLTAPFANPEAIGGRIVLVETPVEILAKKIFYRAADFTARDLFDLAFLIENREADALMADPPMFMPKLEIVLERVETARDGLQGAFASLATADYSPSFEHCIAVVRDFVARNRRAFDASAPRA
jgi:hypothetical protein